MDDIPRIYCFSLGDFHDFKYCPFRFFVSHHLGKKYELVEGSEAAALGSVLDLAIKKFHATKAYGIPVEQLSILIKAAKLNIHSQAEKMGPQSFYGPIASFLTDGVIEKAEEVFKNYYLSLSGKIKYAIHKNKLKPFWKYIIQAEQPLMLWGGADGIEIGDDGVPEVVDYKYYQNNDTTAEKVDMDLMPKVYTLLAASELQEMGYSKARFKIRLWNDPQNESFYEDFDLATLDQLKSFFKNKIERILKTEGLSFCEKDWCKACKSDKKGEWIRKLQDNGWVKSRLSQSRNPIPGVE